MSSNVDRFTKAIDAGLYALKQTGLVAAVVEN